MSIIDVNKVDALGTTKDKEGLMLMITDHLGWLDEYQHLLLLQDKVNAYIAFLEARQYNEIYPNNQFKYCVIEIYLENKPTQNAKHFLQIVQKHLSELSLEIKCNVSVLEKRGLDSKD